MTQSQRRIYRWSVAEEQVLTALRAQYPDYTWEQFTSLYNSLFPSKRPRSIDAVKKKWNKLVGFCKYLYLVMLDLQLVNTSVFSWY
jgi:hypothetical protein